jgi:polyribonucleotide nucleotidyltransferase
MAERHEVRKHGLKSSTRPHRQGCEQLCAVQHELRELDGKEKVVAPQVNEKLLGQITDSFDQCIDEAVGIEDKPARQDAIKTLEDEALDWFTREPDADNDAEVRQTTQLAFDQLE